MSYQSDVEKFMKAGDQPISKKLSIDSKEADLYVNLITEEYKETIEAFENKDIVRFYNFFRKQAYRFFYMFLKGS